MVRPRPASSLSYPFTPGAAGVKFGRYATRRPALGRGLAKLLQGKEAEARAEFDKYERLPNARQFQLQYYLMSTEAQIKERRRRRAESRKGIT